MNEDKTKKLTDRFDFYTNDRGHEIYFEHNDGWFDIIWKLSEQLEKEVEEVKKTDKDYKLSVQQVKEKFGSLRFYIGFGNENMFELINKAEHESARTCECCGRKGKIRSIKGWLACLCIYHSILRKFKRFIRYLRLKRK
jgi:hypothetical protein